MNEKIKKINDIYGESWFEQFIKQHNDICDNLSLDDKINFVMSNSIHGQTSFFRMDEQLYILKHVVLPKYDKPTIAYVGCSTGEEVYSFLIFNYDELDNLFVDGYEINEDRVMKARAGFYNFFNKDNFYSYKNLWGKAFKIKTKRICKKDMEWTHDKLWIKKPLKRHAKFFVHDITKEPLPKKYDIIVMNNVIQHYTDFGRDLIVNNLKDSLNNCGFILFEYGKLPYGTDYDNYFKNIEFKGLIKQETIIPLYGRENDCTWWSRVYKKALQKKQKN